MGTLRQRHVVLEKVAMFMLEQGKVLSKHEYDTMKQVVPLRSGLVLNHFGSWSRMLNIIENNNNFYRFFESYGERLKRIQSQWYALKI